METNFPNSKRVSDGGCGKGGGMRKKWWSTERKWRRSGEMAAGGRMSGPGAGCPGRAGCPGHEPDVRGARASKNTLQKGFRDKNSVDFSDEIWGKVEEKLDPHVAQQIHGTRSTESCQINRSQKKIGALFVWNFSKFGRTRQKQARRRGVGLQNRDQPCS